MAMWLTIDGRELSAEQGETILQVAKRAGIAIPTLCYHAGLDPAGACRICVVEVQRPGRAEAEISPACHHLVEEGLVVQTRSKRAEKVRRAVVDLLLARAPESDRIQSLARRYGLTKTSYVPREDPDLCILCGMCVRICEALGASALSTAGRGAEGQIAVAFFDDASECVGCGACARNCPTGAIPMEEDSAGRTIWGRTFLFERCPGCGRGKLTPEHIELLVERSGLDRSYFEHCDECRRRATADQFKAVMGR